MTPLQEAAELEKKLAKLGARQAEKLAAFQDKQETEREELLDRYSKEARRLVLGDEE